MISYQTEQNILDNFHMKWNKKYVQNTYILRGWRWDFSIVSLVGDAGRLQALLRLWVGFVFVDGSQNHHSVGSVLCPGVAGEEMC